MERRLVKITITGAMGVRGGFPDCQVWERTTVVHGGKEMTMLLFGGSDDLDVEGPFFWLGSDCIIVCHEDGSDWDGSLKEFGINQHKQTPLVHAIVRPGEWDWPDLQLPKVVDPDTREVLEGESLLAHAVKKSLNRQVRRYKMKH